MLFKSTDMRFKRPKVIDIAQRISKLKWQWAGHICRRIDDRWSKRVLEWRPRLGKRSVGRPPARWTDDIRRVAGSGWMRRAEHRAQWRAIGTYASYVTENESSLDAELDPIYIIINIIKRSLDPKLHLTEGVAPAAGRLGRQRIQ
ncbi:unnamed protein product [Spodoptera exigua]|nr:unnamed protein product [Spodoptera exigua]